MSQKEKLRRKKFLRNRKSFILITILSMGIGFAYLTSNLTITGNTSVSGNSWKVYFNSVSITSGSVDASVEPTVTGTTTTSVDYTILLDKPGDFYEFTIEAKNDGTIDAMVESITTPIIASRVQQYMNYSVKYLDGTDVEVTDVLKAKTSTTYKIRIEYRTDIEASDLDENGANMDLSFGVNYTQSDIKDSEFAKLVKSSALSDTTIDFSRISSSTNGEGLYKLSGIENRAHPIYYYRGAVTNNNAKFAGFCWKIVRTTEKGGTKLIYNGLPDEDGYCTNTTESTTMIGTSKYHEGYDSMAYSGYMYGDVYEFQYDKTFGDGKLYGNSFTYSNGTYTLVDTTNSADNLSNYHYTCDNDTGTCNELYYIFINNGYITLQDGKSVEDAIQEMNTNTNDSTLKAFVDDWFENTFNTYFTNLNKDYSDYLEDALWCNDRSENEVATEAYFVFSNQSLKNSGWNPNGGNINTWFWYSSYGRTVEGVPKLSCSNKNDIFSASDRVNGNGALDYPVGLLTADEVMLAGGQLQANNSYYLYNNQNWWLLSPEDLYSQIADNFMVQSDGYMSFDYTMNTHGVRPVIVIKPNVRIQSGTNGTSTSPYEFIVE